MIKSILFVCTGNMCRSPMAEGLMKQKLLAMGIEDIIVGSTGVMTMNGRSASENAVFVMKEKNIDISQHRTNMVKPQYIDDFDLIIAMEQYHWDILVGILPAKKSHIKLMKQFDTDNSDRTEIQDPYGMDLDAYRKCANELSRCLDVIIKEYIKRS
jgi:protein-tyrosine phosphatase